MTDTATPIRPTEERLRQGPVYQAEQDRGGRPKPWHAAEALCDVYLIDKIITKRQWRAGDAFARIYFMAGGSPWKTHGWSPPISGGAIEISDTRDSAQSQIRLIHARLGAELYSVLESVCGQHTPMTTWAKQAGHHPSAGRAVLTIALTMYADHLKLSHEDDENEK